MLRHLMAAPDTDLTCELHHPLMIQVRSPWIRFRDIEGLPTVQGENGDVLQEWLVHFDR